MVTTKDYPKGISWDQGQTGKRLGDKEQPVFRWGIQQLDWPLGQVALLTQRRPASFQHCLLGARSAVTTKSIRVSDSESAPNQLANSVPVPLASISAIVLVLMLSIIYATPVSAVVPWLP